MKGKLTFALILATFLMACGTDAGTTITDYTLAGDVTYTLQTAAFLPTSMGMKRQPWVL
jgi:hypothetical protein